MAKIIIDPEMFLTVLAEVRHFAHTSVFIPKATIDSINDVESVFKRLYESCMSGVYKTEYIQLESP